MVVDVDVDVVEVVVTRGRVSPPLVVIGEPAPVSVAVVPVADGLIVSVTAWVLSAGLRLHAAQIAIAAMAARILLICIVTSWRRAEQSSRPVGANREHTLPGGAVMAELIGRFSAHTFAILRVVSGLMFAMHGSQKLFGLPPKSGPGGGGGLPPLLVAAGVIELVCGLLIAVGFFTGIAAFLASGEMAVAYFTAHAPGAFWPIQNKGEIAVLYCFLWLFVAAHGAGIWSLDNAMRRGTPVITTA